MAGRPAIQFYFGDWKKNQKLRFCSWGARAAWIEVMGLMHDSEEYGVLRQPLKSIAQAIGAPLALIKELVEQGVMKGCASGECEPCVFQPKHAGQLGDPVTLIERQSGPIWYSSRMVRDEYVRTKRGANTRFTGAPKGGNGDSPKGGFGDAFGGPPNGNTNQREGDGSSSSSSSSLVGSSSTSMGTEEGANAMARAVVGYCKVLRKMGMLDAHPGREELLALAGGGFTTEQVALVAAELALKNAGMKDDHELHPELLERYASGANQQLLMLTDNQYQQLRASVPNLGYVRATLEGRARDAAAAVAAAKQTNKRAHQKHTAASTIKGTVYVGTDVNEFDPEFGSAVAAHQLGH